MIKKEGATIKNSDLITDIFNALYNISSRKTTEGYAYSLMKYIKEDFEKDYSFFRFFDFTDIRFIEEGKFVKCKRRIEKVPSATLYPTLKEYIKSLNQSLGKNAGPFFYKEISSKISEDTTVAMNQEGIDFIIMQLEYELENLDKRIHRVKTE